MSEIKGARGRGWPKKMEGWSKGDFEVLGPKTFRRVKGIHETELGGSIWYGWEGEGMGHMLPMGWTREYNIVKVNYG